MNAALDALDESLSLFSNDFHAGRLADPLAGYARVAGLLGLTQVSILLLGGVSSLLESITIARVDHMELHDRARALALEQTAPDVFAHLFEQGRALALPDLLALTAGVRAPGQAGQVSVAPAAIADPFKQHLLTRLTPRERDVLRLLAEGHSNRDIADMLFLQVTTVKSHIASILSKLGASSRTAAVALLLKNGKERE